MFHGLHQLESIYKPAKVTLLSMFTEIVNSVAMIHHVIEMVKCSLHRANPDQVPVTALD